MDISKEEIMAQQDRNYPRLVQYAADKYCWLIGTLMSTSFGASRPVFGRRDFSQAEVACRSSRLCLRFAVVQ